MTPTSLKKNEKKVGPLRTGLVTFVVVFIAIWLTYCSIFLDKHLRYVLEWGATQGNGAEVNIDQVKTSFWNLSLTISNVQVTNAEIPSQNIVAFDVLNFQMTMDALLRGKIVIEDASLMGLRFNSKRGKIGYVLPPKPIDPKSEEPSPMMKAVLKQRDLWVKNEFESSILSDVVTLLQSDDLKEALNDSLKELKSQEQIDQLLQEWPEKRKLWESKLVVLKEKNTVEKLYQQAKDIKPSKEPKEILDQLKQVQEIRKKAKIEYDSYKNDYVSLTQDVTTFKNRVNSLPDLVKQDLDAIKQKLKIPTLDAKKSGQEIFQRLIYQYTGPYVPYLEKARPYWESSKKAKTERPKPASRGQGINVHFPITKGYPTFWLKKMILSSDTKKTVATDHKYALQGELKNVTTHPKVVNAPIELALKGDLLSQEILGIDSLLSMDLRDNFIVRASLDIASLPVKEFSLAKSSKLQLALEQAKAKLNLAMIFAKGEMDFKTRIDLSDNLWVVQTEKEAVTSSVNNILHQINGFYVLASLSGAWNKATMSIDSDFMERFLSGIKLEVEKKVTEIKAKIEEQVKEKISTKQNELLSKLSSDQKDILSPLLAIDGTKQGLLKGFDQFEKELENKAKDKGKEKFTKELDKLKNKIKLPF